MPVKDRLEDLQLKAARIIEERLERSNSILELETTFNLQEGLLEDSYLKIFLNQVEDLYEILEELEMEIDKTCGLQTTFLEFANSNKVQALYDLYDGIRKNATEITKHIKAMEVEVKSEEFTGTDQEKLICSMQLMALQRKISDSMFRYYNILDDYKTKCKERIRRQMAIADVKCTDFNYVVDEPTSVFMKQLIPDMNITSQILDEVKSRHEQLLSVEKSIQKMRDLFMDIVLILETEQEMIHKVEKVVLMAKKDVHVAGDHLRRAERNAGVKTIHAIILLIILIIIAVAFIIKYI